MASVAVSILLATLSAACVFVYLFCANDVPPRRRRDVMMKVWGADEWATDVDIIAIHGLDTDSETTWTWKDKKTEEEFNWLWDAGMLPSRVGRARIFTCDWLGHSFRHKSETCWSLDELAKRILVGIEGIRSPNRSSRTPERPILFIASCFGGTILTKALAMIDHQDSEYYHIRKATRGVVFLATPFRGTAFEDIAQWGERYLRLKAFWRGNTRTQLLQMVKGATSESIDRLNKLSRMTRDREYPVQIRTFYETKGTSLLKKYLPHLLMSAKVNPPLVSPSSATPDFTVGHPLDRVHVMMNKFGPEEKDYQDVVTALVGLLALIRQRSSLEQADLWIRERCYTDERLQITRLSGDALPLDQCYINLAISKRSQPTKAELTGSPFSLLAQQKVHNFDKAKLIELATVFEPRQNPDNRSLEPRRILIRGNAGIGKTTLCKKIVHEFRSGSWEKWSHLFDRVLWVPLRNLKLEERHSKATYYLKDLFHHEYFALSADGKELAQALYQAVESKPARTLFLLDGLDEVSELLIGEASMARFLKDLLEKPNVIFTARPSAQAPANLDLELETVGFLPPQVQQYIESTFSQPHTRTQSLEKTEAIRNLLRRRWLMAGLVRIPIQLDALCYVWNGAESGEMPETMTGIYTAIDQKLWRKDILRLGKMDEHRLRDTFFEEIRPRIEAERVLLECLAFYGMHEGVVDFTPKHLRDIVQFFDSDRLSLVDTLVRLSFLRTSTPFGDEKLRNYHFIHLTYQEYFAAKYFVRHWKSQKPLRFASKLLHTQDEPINPLEFLQTRKYEGRYDVFWRFVAGLIYASEGSRVDRFYREIESEPRDLLGPAHQRLIMHCLGETCGYFESRDKLITNLGNWAFFEVRHGQDALLIQDEAFPHEALRTALDKASHTPIDSRQMLKSALEQASTAPEALRFIEARLHDETLPLEDKMYMMSCCKGQTTLPRDLIDAIATYLRHESRGAQRSALRALSSVSTLPNEVLELAGQLALCGDDIVAQSAMFLCLNQPTLLEKAGIALKRHLNASSNWNFQIEALETLQHQKKLLPGMLLAIHKIRVDCGIPFTRRLARQVIKHFGGPPAEDVVTALQHLYDGDWRQRQIAMELLLDDTVSEETTAVVATMFRANKLGWEHKSEFLEVLRSKILPQGIIMDFIRYWTDVNRVDTVSVEILSKQSLSHKVIAKVTQYLHNSHLRKDASKILGQQSLSDDHITALVEVLQDGNAETGSAAIEAMRPQKSLPLIALETLVARLGDSEIWLRNNAFLALQGRTLPEVLVLEIVKMVEGRDSSNIGLEHAFDLLQNQTLTDSLIHVLEEALQDQDDTYNWSATSELLQSHPKLLCSILHSSKAHKTYNNFLRRSFYKHNVWFAYKDSFHFTSAVKTTSFSMLKDAKASNVQMLVLRSTTLRSEDGKEDLSHPDLDHSSM